jgi:putative acetyltransferase
MQKNREMDYQYTTRLEETRDEAPVRALVERAFADVEHSEQTEHLIVEALRLAGDLSISLVAEHEGEVIGYVAFSPVSVSNGAADWFGLGPVAVQQVDRRRGMGAALIERGLAELRSRRANGCVVLGDPEYYQRFGFRHDPALQFEGAPPEYFLALHFAADEAQGVVTYRPAFFVKAQ